MLNNFMASGLRFLLSGGNAGAGRSITIFSGAQPSASNIISSWTTYNSSALVHWTTSNWLTPPDSNTLSAAKSTTTSIPTATVAIGSGTAQWGILWSSVHTVGAIQATTIPSQEFIVVPVSGPTGSGVIKLASTSITSGTSYTYTDTTIRMGIS